MQILQSRDSLSDGAAGPYIFFWLLLFYLPTLHDLVVRYWLHEEQAYSVIVAVAIVALFWSARKHFVAAPAHPHRVTGYVSLGCGLLAFVIGRALGVMALEVGSAIPALIGVLLITHGIAALRVYWLPIIYLCFLVPIPEMLVESVTGPLKISVSHLAENLLYALDYPVARMGVTLSIGKYQLLVADACSGMRSIFSLFALGLIYLHVVHRPSWLHNLILLLAIVPLALLANFARVVTLMLLVYYYGEAVAQGFMHGFSGLILFAVAVLAFIGIDYALLFFLTKRCRKPIHAA